MEEEKYNKILEKVLAGLTGEQKAKAAECKDEGELCELLEKLGVALPDELLDGAAGGFVWNNPGLVIGGSDQNDGQATGNPDPFTPSKPKRIF